MDGREGMTLSGPGVLYYLNRGAVSGSGVAGGSAIGAQPGPPVQPPAFKSLSILNVPLQPGYIGGHGVSATFASPVTPGDPVKKKRGRPRKYAPDGANMSLGLSPVLSTPSLGPKPARGRPPGSGWKQQLSQLGEWMNSSAGLAFTPHVIHIGVGEDVATKILSFAQQRPRALCILSGNGSVSAVTLRQPVTSSGVVTYEGRFQILCMSGSYLLAEAGDPRNRTGGLSISVCGRDGQVIGGAIGGELIAASHVQVVVCSFVYGGKTKNKPDASTQGEISASKHAKRPLTSINAAPNKDLNRNSVTVAWPPGLQPSSATSQTQFDMTRG